LRLRKTKRSRSRRNNQKVVHEIRRRIDWGD
jgi:hypothetical protein